MPQVRKTFDAPNSKRIKVTSVTKWTFDLYKYEIILNKKTNKMSKGDLYKLKEAELEVFFLHSSSKKPIRLVLKGLLAETTHATFLQSIPQLEERSQTHGLGDDDPRDGIGD